MASTVSPLELDRLLRTKGDPLVIDVRSPAEFAGAHVAGTRNIPLAELDPAVLAAREGVSRGRTVHLLCQGGTRAKAAAERLEKAGFTDVVVVEGGVDNWRRQGLALVEGRQAISLERQVRIAAGSLVLLGFALSLIHPAFLALSAFVGAGLVFAGVTDFCGLGLVLARAPWNTRSAS